jgi:hypothetical protein
VVFSFNDLQIVRTLRPRTLLRPLHFSDTVGMVGRLLIQLLTAFEGAPRCGH